MPIRLEWIKEKVRRNEYYFSKHADQERQNDGLEISQIEEAIFDATVLEQYEDTGRGESCLICGFTDRKAIHIVCGRRGESMVIITVYIPGPPKFRSPYERA